MGDEIERRDKGAVTATVPWEYAAAPESKEIVRIQDRYGLFIEGRFVDPLSGRTFETINPATEETLSVVSEAGPEDVDLAVRAAEKAWESSWHRVDGCPW